MTPDSPNTEDSITGRLADMLSGRFGELLIFGLVCGCAAMMAASLRYYAGVKMETEETVRKSMTIVTDTRSRQLENWRRERIGDGRVLMVGHVNQAASRVLANDAASAADRDEVTERMRAMAAAYQYSDISLVDREGRIALRLGAYTSNDELRQPARRKAALDAQQAKDALLTELSPDTQDGNPRMSLLVPVNDNGAFILEIDAARFLYPYLDSWPGYSKSGETLLIHRNGDDLTYLNTGRVKPGIPVFTHRKLALKLPPPATLDAGWVFEDKDYRGVPIIAALRKVAGSNWYVLSKIAVDEVDEPVRRLGLQTALIMALIGLGATSFAGLVVLGQRGHISREKENWFRTVANETPAYLWMMSTDGSATFLNNPLRRFLGIGPDILAWTTSDSVHPDDLNRVRDALRQSVAAGREYADEFRVRRADGAYRVVACQTIARFTSKGAIAGFAGSLRDITERKHAEMELHASNTTLRREKEASARKEQEVRSLSARLIGAREEERKRLARELHDDLNQQIAAVSIAMGNLKRQIPVDQAHVRGQSDLIQRTLVQISESVHRMSHELHPAILEYRGLAAALRVCCDEFGALTGIHVTLFAGGNFEDVPVAASLCIYRIVQEALQNIARHANTPTATVNIARESNALQLAVSDSGVGMPADPNDRKQGLGLISIRERAEMLGGQVEILSSPQEGTLLKVTLPF